MSNIEIDNDFRDFLNTMKNGDETVDDALCRVLLTLQSNDTESIKSVLLEETDLNDDEILRNLTADKSTCR